MPEGGALKIAIQKHVLEQKKFSPSSVARKFGIDLADAAQYCEAIASSNQGIVAWFKVVCPLCQAVPFGEPTKGKLPIGQIVTCRDCDETFECTDKDIFLYFVNDRVSESSPPSNSAPPKQNVKKKFFTKQVAKFLLGSIARLRTNFFKVPAL